MLNWLVWRFFDLWKFLGITELTGWTFKVGYEDTGRIVEVGLTNKSYYDSHNTPIKYPNKLQE